MWFEKIKRIPFLRPSYHFILAFWGALIYGWPSRNIFVIGITGTKGKTTVLELASSIFEQAGYKTALLSSTTVKIDKERGRNTLDITMPGRFFIQRFLKKASAKGCQYAFIEVTSEGVVQHRHRFIEWNMAVFLNLHPEHIESHGSFDKYRKAKLDFFRYAAKSGASFIVNQEDENSKFFRRVAGSLPQFEFSKDTALAYADVLERNKFFKPQFNKLNAAAAITIAQSLGINKEVISRALLGFKGVPGRMEIIQTKPFKVVIDYAHTPVSLELVYKELALNKKSSSQLICVLGSAGGGRDKWKRPVLGRIASQYCGVIFLTNEDPYDEDPFKIINEIEEGIRHHPNFESKLSNLVFKIEDREKAIREAIKFARSGDIVVITGKGSEEWVHIKGGKKIPWSDKRKVQEILEELKINPAKIAGSK